MQKMKENGNNQSIEEVVEPFLVMDEANRRKPIPENVEVYRKQKEMYAALSARVRGSDLGDPFSIRAKML